MTDAPKLLPCPFCGGTNLFVFTPTCTERSPYNPADNAQPVVRCLTCYAEVMGKTWDHSKATAVTAWNTRADLIPAMIEAARQEAAKETLTLVLAITTDIASKLNRLGDIGGAYGLATLIKTLEEYANTIPYQVAQVLAASPPTPTPVDGENSGETVGKGGA